MLSKDAGLIIKIVIKKVAILSIVLGMFARCTVGPNFSSPEAPEISSYVSRTNPEQTASAPVLAGEAQLFVYGKEVPNAWWELFNSASLDHVIYQALSSSPTMASAEAVLQQAAENAIAVHGNLFFPQVDLSGSSKNYWMTHKKMRGTSKLFNPNTTSNPNPTSAPIININRFNLFNASLDVSFNFDVFGGTRRQVEAAIADVDVKAYNLLALHLTLASNVATAAFREAMLRAQIVIIRSMIEMESKRLSIAEKQLKAGSLSQLSIYAQTGQLEQTKARLPSLEKSLEQIRNQLAIYIGELPSEACLPEFYLEDFTLPPELPLSLPSSLVRRRPDILAAEANLHEATAFVGVAIANLYPQFTLSAGYGPLKIKGSDLFSLQAWVASLGASFTQPIFHGGQLIAERQKAIAVYDQALADYTETVLEGFQQVADALTALEHDAKELAFYASAMIQMKETLRIVSKQFELGGANYLNLLDAERQYLEATLKVAQAQATRLADTAALFQALGGGCE
ncbi:MAG: efflux transporter outer membrane subunit [Parachlamydiaceae bacterium]|nr:efflux transporter outer membrane subunit [Parachlamydiaceae bacterium]